MYQDILTKTGFFGKLDQDTLQLVFVSLLFLLVAVGAFGLGRLSGLSEAKTHLRVYAPQAIAAGTQLAAPIAAVGKAPSATLAGGAAVDGPEPAHNFVASKNGSKYYSAGCSGASRIKPANEVWFASAIDAEAAGYTLAAACK